MARKMSYHYQGIYNDYKDNVPKVEFKMYNKNQKFKFKIDATKNFLKFEWFSLIPSCQREGRRTTISLTLKAKKLFLG